MGRSGLQLDPGDRTPTNNAPPTGGVQSPMQRLKIIMMPKWTGSHAELGDDGQEDRGEDQHRQSRSMKTISGNDDRMIADDEQDDRGLSETFIKASPMV